MEQKKIKIKYYGELVIPIEDEESFKKSLNEVLKIVHEGYPKSPSVINIWATDPD